VVHGRSDAPKAHASAKQHGKPGNIAGLRYLSVVTQPYAAEPAKASNRMTTVSAVMAMVGLRPFNRPLAALVGIEVDQHIGITSFAHQLLQVESTNLAAREGKLTIMVVQLEEVGLRHRGADNVQKLRYQADSKALIPPRPATRDLISRLLLIILRLKYRVKIREMADNPTQKSLDQKQY
jgi:hypothetical protein